LVEDFLIEVWDRSRARWGGSSKMMGSEDITFSVWGVPSQGGEVCWSRCKAGGKDYYAVRTWGKEENLNMLISIYSLLRARQKRKGVRGKGRIEQEDHGGEYSYLKTERPSEER